MGKIEPAMVRVVSEAVDLTDLVTINEICRNKILGSIDCASHTASGVDSMGPRIGRQALISAPMPQSFVRFSRRQVIPYTARARLCGVIIMHRPDIVPGVFFTLLGELNVANLVVKGDCLLGASHLL
jgi:hypothetical protein